jgi:UDP-N-acetylglucosamine/UDP-N-acetylgalactosamine diphosphorylase
MTDTSTPLDELRAAFDAAGQGHVFRRYDRLDDAARPVLEDELRAVDLELVTRLAALTGRPAEAGGAPEFEPPDLFPLARTAAHEAEAEAATQTGEALLAAGKVGYVLVAGGQASRLGYDGPKGCFPIGPVSGRTLFELGARRLRAARERWGCATPWYIMTSPANDAPTRAFFEEHDHFGLPAEDVVFFSQSMLPALDTEGRILFASEGRLFLAPNGHGGVLLGLASSGLLADARGRGVEQFSYFQVDNPFVRPADPLFLGLHERAGAGMSTKVVEKTRPDEKVGVIGRVDGKMGCIEYSDLPASLREQRDAEGRLAFRAGNIAVHALSLEFVEQVTGEEGGGIELPWHVARKKMRVAAEDGTLTEVEGFKFEAFVFDALASSETSVTLEVDRAFEFSPVKNATGEDSPATTRRDLCRLHAGWAERAGRALPGADDTGEHPVEVDPLFAETEVEFRARLAQRTDAPRQHGGGHLYD